MCPASECCWFSFALLAVTAQPLGCRRVAGAGWLFRPLARDNSSGPLQSASRESFWGWRVLCAAAQQHTNPTAWLHPRELRAAELGCSRRILGLLVSWEGGSNQQPSGWAYWEGRGGTWTGSFWNALSKSSHLPGTLGARALCGF